MHTFKRKVNAIMGDMKNAVILLLIVILVSIIVLASVQAAGSYDWGITRYGAHCWTRTQAQERGYVLKYFYKTEESCHTDLQQRGEG